MEKIVAAFTKTKTKTKRDDDFIDRLSHRYTCVILVAFAVVVSMTQFVGKPITCWAPKHFTGNHIKYTNSFCWIRNTYYLPWDEPIPRPHQEEERQYIIYYQWIPFILLIQAIFFYLPTVVWHGLNQKAGVDSDNILASAGTFQQSVAPEKRNTMLQLINNQINRFLGSRMDRVATWKLNLKNCMNLLFCGCCGKRMGSYLIILFVFSKMLFAANAIGQLFILNNVFQVSYNTFGVDFFNHLANVDDWWLTNPVFPRVTFCDFDVRRLGNTHRYTVQCVLPINLFVEKMYVFLWFWIVLVSILTCLSLATWIIRFLFHSDRLKFLENHLNQMHKLDDPGSKKLLKEFLDMYLRQDGAFILRLIAHNTNNITTTEIICSLWDFWLAKRKDDMPDLEEFEPDQKRPLSDPEYGDKF
ncbi:hypothetical protein CAPTEDRAFT_148862 [Capitella teleta]|uniref:Innexin n=1 Tax=Capitella teleta TaxID=283909 RepID=R7VJQ0_CAPTE|nr:hypothetical protein CAPTEDRAFT_148862 [Capitella teleta]|eukprot:ELU16110.1 hypothetical protein CAPTEDRAFT_148862 [Capitella teleta]